ncbi:MAG: DNA-formamidopyrimidine glycosylase [bacterium]|nr:DNA-formamidopyrimidine glycosylase [bacterium]
MPELPEVQTVVNDLNKKIAGRKITGVWFDWPKMIKDPLNQSRTKVARKHVAAFEDFVKGEKFVEFRRRAKNILIYLTHGKMLLAHLKMTGHLLVGKWEIKYPVLSSKYSVLSMGSKNKCQVIPLSPKAVVEDPYNKYIHLIFYLDNGQMLGFSDLRKFAKIISGPKEVIENLPELAKLGPEPLDKSFTYEKFKATLRQAQGKKIKQVLMDQEVIAGIGNIYSDDILWKAKINPFRPANELKNAELKNIYKAMREVLAKALKLRGTSTSDFRDTAGEEGGYTEFRAVYGREDEPCPRCGAKIVRKKIGGRSAHFCPECQK